MSHRNQIKVEKMRNSKTCVMEETKLTHLFICFCMMLNNRLKSIYVALLCKLTVFFLQFYFFLSFFCRTDSRVFLFSTSIFTVYSVSYFHQLFFYFIFIFILQICRKAKEALIHRASNYPDLLPKMPRYCYPLEI